MPDLPLATDDPIEAPLLSVRDLSVQFRRRRTMVAAVRNVSFDIRRGETLGLVGESGSGKTTIGRAILGLVSPHAGAVSFCGEEIINASPRRRRLLARDLQVIFQDPYSSLNPARTVGASLLEAAGPNANRQVSQQRMDELLVRVGLTRSAAHQYPSRFSGGQRQRLAVARSLMPNPSLVICDEAVSALDVSIQAQVLNLLKELQQETGLAYLFISHDLDVVRFMSDRVIVLYHGRLLEHGPAEEIAIHPRSPYTRALLAASGGSGSGLAAANGAPIAGERPVASDVNGAGCPFAPRCPRATHQCEEAMPDPRDAGTRGHWVACHHPEADVHNLALDEDGADPGLSHGVPGQQPIT